MRSVRTRPGEFKTRRGLHAHFSAFGMGLAAVVLLAGCAPLPARVGPRAVVRQPLAELELPAAGERGRAMALAIAAEFALQDGDLAGATADYAKAARISDDPAVAERAVRTALAADDADLATAMVARWAALGAAPRQLAGARAQLALARGDRTAAESQFRLLLASGGVDDWKTFAADLLAAPDHQLAGAILAELATPARLPADESLWVALGQLGEHLGAHAFARQLAEATVRRFDGVVGIRWAASLRLADDDRTGAAELYEKGLAAHPRNTDLRLGYAFLLGDDHRYAEAMRVLAAGPQTSQTWTARVAMAGRAKDVPAQRALYAELERNTTPPPEDRDYLLGLLADSMGHDQQALGWYGKVDPDGTHAFDAAVRSVILLDRTGQSAQAHELAGHLQQDYADDPDSLRAAYELDAQLYARHGEHAKAVAVYDRGLAAMPHDPELTYDRGIAEANAGDTAAALEDFRAVLKQNPDNVDAMNALGFTLADADRDLPEATALLRKALAAKPDSVAIMDSWGWLQYRLGHIDEAEVFLKRAWGKQEDPDIGVHLGEVLWTLGRHGDARAVFAQVRKLDPHNTALLDAEQRLRP